MNSNILKHVTKVLMLILLLSFLVDKVVFYMLNKVSDQVFTGQSIGKLNHFLELSEELDLVVFGSSRANHNIDPKKLAKKSFNMGMDGRMLAYSATMIKLLPLQKKQTVLLHVDNENAFSKHYKGADIKALSTKYNRSELIKNEIEKLRQANPLQFFYWSLSYNSSLLGIVKNRFRPNYNYKTYSGFDPIRVSKSQRQIFKKMLDRESVDDCMEQREFVLNDIYAQYLDELKELCQKNNKTLILFSSPKYSDPCKEDNIAFAQILKDKKLTYYDFTDSFNNNNKIEYWKDKVHLSDEGAAEFTQMVKATISL